MTPAARVQAAIECLDQIYQGRAAEQVLTSWARRSRFAGSKDRAAVRDHVFDALRRRRSTAALGGGDTGRQAMIGLLRQSNVDLDTIFNGVGHGPAPMTPLEREAGHEPGFDAEKYDLPDWLWPRFVDSLGQDAAIATAVSLQQRAPVFLRVNLLKTNLEQAKTALSADDIETKVHPESTTALRVVSGTRKIRMSRAFMDGWVELQDAASQAVVDALPIDQGARILDMCAGGGGKTLAIAARTGRSVDAYDAAPQRLRDLPERARRAGAQVRILETLENFEPYDLVLCDAPCSGSGAWARVPEGKWRLTEAELDSIKQTQAEILDQAKCLLRPGGTLAYATCSVLVEENRGQIDAFVHQNSDWKVTFEQSWGALQETDGFYTAHLTQV